MFARVAVVGALLGILGGCVRYEETLQVDETAKGTLTIVMTRPELETDSAIARDFNSRFAKANMKKNLPGTVTLSYEETTKDGRVTVKAVYRFNHINDLVRWAAGANLPFNQLSVSLRPDDGVFQYTRRFGPFDQDQMEDAQRYAPDAVAVFKVIGPGKLSTGNPTRTEGDAAVWEIQVPALVSRTTTDLRAEFTFGTSRWVLALPVAIVIVGAAAVILLKRRRGAPASSAGAQV